MYKHARMPQKYSTQDLHIKYPSSTTSTATSIEVIFKLSTPFHSSRVLRDAKPRPEQADGAQ